MIDVNVILNTIIAASVVGGLAKLIQIEKRLTHLEATVRFYLKENLP